MEKNLEEKINKLSVKFDELTQRIKTIEKYNAILDKRSETLWSAFTSMQKGFFGPITKLK